MNALSRFKTSSPCFVVGFVLGFAPCVFGAEPALLVDRGLPQANLNKASGEYRSNIRWSSYDSGFLGDDFTVGAAGESWVIDSIRVWTVPGVNKIDPEHLGDFYQDVRLYFGGPEEGLSPIATGRLAAGSSQSSNASILISNTSAAGGSRYEDVKAHMQVWQIDFTQLNQSVQGGVKYRFGAFGLGRTVLNKEGQPNKAGKTYAWFNAASHAPLSGAKQDGADGQMLLFTSGGKFTSSFSGKDAGWDKTSDINVQVFGHRVN
ncbi:MAG TPA: hypothetical protein VK724_14300 [Bryobacteraceae bacterium]|jgi:hypothetical protein|nr:hypothetical protein [Bryobacteraceae bacterium]